MTRLIQLFFDICLFRKGPQDVPASRLLLRIAVGLYVISGAVVLLILEGGGVVRNVSRSLLDLALLAGVAWAALQWYRYPARLGQTLTALTGCGVVFTVIDLPLARWLHLSAMNGSPDAAMPAMLWLLILIWNLLVIAHILRHAVQRPFALGMALAVVYLAANWVFLSWLFPTGR